MCGICGIYNLNGSADLLSEIFRMSEIVQHRGPDDSGWVAVRYNGEVISDQRSSQGITNGRTMHGDFVLGLGHRRLSIIDLSLAGHQPMRDTSDRYWIVYNGEVYNYIELRAELSVLGCDFRSNTDTEVVLHAFIQWGPECLTRFNGMWAFAIYDSQNETLFCARDRYGVKPFYYAYANSCFAFGSEAKQLVFLPWVGSKANLDRVADFFLWGLENHTDETFFSGIMSLPNSHYLMVTREDLKKGHLKPTRYWQPTALKIDTEKEAIERFRDLMFDSVRLRLRSDVPVGVTLSGGLDSSSIVCIAGEHYRNSGNRAALNSFNVEFEGKHYSECRFAEAAARQAGSRFIVLRPNQHDLARDWLRFVWHMEQPFQGLSYFSNFQIYNLIRQHGIPVVLSGQGADELLMGYDRYRSHHTFFTIKAMRPFEALAEMIYTCWHGNMSFFKQLIYGLYFLTPWFRAIRRRNLMRPLLKKTFFKKYADKIDHLNQITIHSDEIAFQQSELFRYQLPLLLFYEDRMSMAHSIETRLPFLDYRLLEVVMGQISNLLFRHGWSKYILREAMNGILPKDVQWRTDKMGYNTPTGCLIRQNREIFLPLFQRHRDDKILDVLAFERSFESNVFDERVLCRAVSYLTWKEAFSVLA